MHVERPKKRPLRLGPEAAVGRAGGARAGRSEQGFTLLELMATVALVGVLATLAFTSAGSWTKGQRLREMARETFNALSLARAEAIKTGTQVWVAVDSDSVKAFRDGNNNDLYDTGEELIYEFPRAGAGGGFFSTSAGASAYAHLSMSSTLTPVSGVGTAVFDTRGFCRDTSGSLQTGTITVDGDDGGSYEIEITVAGAIKVAR